MRSRGFTGGHRTSWQINVQTCSDSCDMCDLAGVKEQKVPTVRCRVRESSRAHYPLLPCMTCMSCCITFGYSYCLISGGRTRICVGSIVVHIVMHLAFVLNSFASLLMRRSESRAFRDHAPGPVSKFFGFFGACTACQSSGSIPASPF